MKKSRNVLVVMCFILMGYMGAFSEIKTIEDLDDAAVFSFSVMGDHKANSPNGDKMKRMINWNKQHHEFCIGMGDHANGQEEVPANDMDQTRHNPFLKFMAEDPWFGKHFYPNIGDHDNQINPEENPGDKKWVWGAGWVMFNYVGNPQDDYLYNNDIPMGTAPFFKRRNVEFRPANGPQVPCTKTSRKYDDKLVDYYAWFDHSTHPGIPSGYKVHLISLSFGNMQMLAPQSATFMENKLLELDAIRGDKDIIIVAAQVHDWIRKAKRFGYLSNRQIDLVMEVADLTVEGNHHKYQWVNFYFDDYDQKGALWVNGGSVTASTQTGTGYLAVHVLANPTRLTVQYINTASSTRRLHKGDIEVSSRLPKHWTSPYMKEVNGGKVTRIDDWGDIEVSAPPANKAPKFVKDPFSKGAANVGEFYDKSIYTSATDPDGDELSFEILTGPSWLSISDGRRIQGTPSASDIGLNEFNVRVRDSGGLSDNAVMNINVNGTVVNQPPYFTVDPILKGDATVGIYYLVPFGGKAVDPDLPLFQRTTHRNIHPPQHRSF